jgi:hypothetical protein
MPAPLTRGPPIDAGSAPTHEAAAFDFNEELTVQVLTLCLGKIIDVLAEA